MPIYEYQCKQCAHQFEQIQKINDKPIVICPECSQSSVERLISASGFQLKGTGWYVTDFKNNGTKPKDSSKNNKTTPKKQTSSHEKKGESN